MINRRLHSLATGALVALLLFVVGVSHSHAAAPAQDTKVAVLPFAVNAGDDLAYLEDSLPELISDRLAEAGFTVVDADEMARLISEKGYTTFDTKTARELALLTGAGFAVYGSLNQIGDILNIDARLVDAFGTTPGKKISVREEGLINLLPLVDGLVSRMKTDLLRLDVIGEVDVEGTKVLDKEVVLMRLSLQKGDLLTAKSVNAALKNIYDLGYFDDVTVKVEETDEGKKVIFDVKEKPRIQALGVRGSDEIDAEDIIEAISTKKGGVINLKVLADDIRVIREMYRKEGYYKAKVTHEIEDTGTGIARLSFVIDEGPKLYIENVFIDGAEQVDPDDVKDVLSLNERGFFSWITDSGVLKEELLDRDAAAIQAFYQTKGFLHVKVGRPEVNITDEGIDVTYQVWEGDRFKMGRTLFRGDLIEDTPKLLEITKIDELNKQDEFFDRSKLQKDIEELTTYYNNYGYAYVDVGVNLKDDPENRIVDVVYTVTKHQRVHIRRVLVEGNTITRDNVILREMRLADGDMFHGSKLRRSYQRLNNLNFFEKVDISPVPTGNPEEMDLLVKVKDKATGTVGGGIGYSTYENVYIAANISESNLFGKGYGLSFNAAFSGVRTAFVVEFTNPHINDTNVGYSIETHHKDEEFNTYDKKSTGGTLSFFYPIGEYSRWTWGYTLDHYVLDNISDDASDTVQDDAGTHLLSQLSWSFSRDTRDDTRNPRSGTRGVFSMRLGGGVIGGTDDFVKYTSSLSWWTPLFEEVVFHTKVWGGFVHQNLGGEAIPTDQRFELGGIYNVRGYGRYDISPLDEDGEEMGGDKAVYTNVELSRVIDKEYGISAFLFFDAGNSWKESEGIFSSPVRKGTKPSFGLYKSLGTGINWYSPVGPIGIVYGYGLDPIGDSGRHKFEFVMGQMF